MKNNITLRQGLEIFRQKNKNHLSHNKGNLSNEAKTFFDSHDVAHVLFGCDISLYGEGSVKIWTIFGTTLGFWGHLKAYQSANAYGLSKSFTFTHMLKNIGKLLVSIPLIIFRAKQMTKPWNWAAFDRYLDTPISTIRKDFNINILT